MPETEVTGTPAAAPPAPAPAPASEPKTADIRSAAQDAIRSIREKQGSEPQKTTVPEPASPASAPEPKPAEKFDLSSVDWSKQTPEVLALRKELLGDYTRKTQEVAEQRKQYDERIQKQDEILTKLLDRMNPPQEGPAVADPKDQIRQLREEGRHDEADAMVLELAEKAATDKVAGLERQAKINELKTTFRDTVSEISSNDRLVHDFKDKVAEVWDANTPQMQEFRAFVLQSPERVKAFLPEVFNLIAARSYAATLEQNFQKAVQEGIAAGIKAEKEAASRVKSPLVPSGSGSHDSPASGTRDIRAAVATASRQLRGE